MGDRTPLFETKINADNTPNKWEENVGKFLILFGDITANIWEIKLHFLNFKKEFLSEYELIY